jgi:hydrogenase maturation factor
VGPLCFSRAEESGAVCCKWSALHIYMQLSPMYQYRCIICSYTATMRLPTRGLGARSKHRGTTIRILRSAVAGQMFLRAKLERSVKEHPCCIESLDPSRHDKYLLAVHNHYGTHDNPSALKLHTFWPQTESILCTSVSIVSFSHHCVVVLSVSKMSKE